MFENTEKTNSGATPMKNHRVQSVATSNGGIYSHSLKEINTGNWQKVKTDFAPVKLVHQNKDTNMYAIGKNGEFLVHGSVITV